MHDETENLIEEKRQAGQDYIDAFEGNLKAAVADLNRRTAARGQTPVPLPPKKPYPWQLRLDGAATKIKAAIAESAGAAAATVTAYRPEIDK